MAATPTGGGGSGGMTGGFGMGMSALTQGLQMYSQQQMLKGQEKQLKTAQKLQQWAIDKKRRQLTGRALSDMGASGTDVDLEYIDRLNYEFELDKAVMNEEYRIAKRTVSDSAKMALVEGIGKTITEGIDQYQKMQQGKTTAETTKNQSQYWKPELANQNDPMQGLKNDPTDPYGLKKKANWYTSMFGV